MNYNCIDCGWSGPADFIEGGKCPRKDCQSTHVYSDDDWEDS